MIKIRSTVTVQSYWLLFLSFFLLNGFSDAVATELVRNLPIQVKTDRDKTFSIPLEDRLKNQQWNKLLFDEKVVFVKTSDDKVIKLPLWQIDRMPVLFKELSQQKENSLLNPVDISQINGGIGSKELQLLSHTWTSVQENAALPFIKDLPQDRLLILNAAAEKVGSGLLYATTSNFLLSSELRYQVVQSLITPVTYLLEEWGYPELKEKETFQHVSDKTWNLPASSDGTKWLCYKGDQLVLYDLARNFVPKELKTLTLSKNTERYEFSLDNRMLVEIPENREIKGGFLYCWDTLDDCKMYTIKYSNFVAEVAFGCDGKTLVFTESDQFVEPKSRWVNDNVKGNKIFVCKLTEDNPVPQEISWGGSWISLIIISPDNKQLMCTSEKKIYCYNDLDSLPLSSLKPIKIGNDHSYDLKSITFTPDSTKFMCWAAWRTHFKSDLYLYERSADKGFTLKNNFSVDSAEGRIIFNPAGTACVIQGSNEIFYWDGANVKEVVNRYNTRYNALGASKITFSPNGKVCAFAKGSSFYYFNVDDLKPKLNEDALLLGPSHIYSIVFTDNKNFFVLMKNSSGITKNSYSFNYEDLKNCNLGAANVLYNFYYKNIRNEKYIDITKGTLSYELFKTLPIEVQSRMQSALKVRVIDEPKILQKDHAEIAAEEILPDEAVMAKLHYYLKQPRQKNTHFQDMEKAVAAWKINEIDEAPKTIQQEKIIQGSQQATIFWKGLSDLGERIYLTLPIWMQKWVRTTTEKNTSQAIKKRPTSQQVQDIKKGMDEYLNRLDQNHSQAEKVSVQQARNPTPEEQKYIQQLTDEELQGFKQDFSEAEKIVKAKETRELERKRAEFEKTKEDMRRYFKQPRLQDQEGFQDLEAIKKTVDALKPIYQPGTLDYEAFHSVVKEMGLE